jgi:hypothetical protein
VVGPREWDFFIAAFGETHRGGHILWPDGRDSESEVLASALLDVYRALDRALGELLSLSTLKALQSSFLRAWNGPESLARSFRAATDGPGESQIQRNGARPLRLGRPAQAVQYDALAKRKCSAMAAEQDRQYGAAACKRYSRRSFVYFRLRLVAHTRTRFARRQ